MLFDATVYGVADMMDTVEDCVSQLCSRGVDTEENRYRLKLVLCELIGNSLEYARTEVRLLARQREDGVRAVVIDRGPGFNCESSICHSPQEVLMCEHGRGLFIVNTLCDRYRHNRKGNIIAINLKFV